MTSAPTREASNLGRRARCLLAIAPLGAALALAACGGTAASKSAAPASSASGSAQPGRGGIQLSVRPSQYGSILRDGTDRTIYLFTHDRSTSSTCYAGCATAWPPVLTTGAPSAGTGLSARLLGTTHRSDGTLQVTYGGHPLYYYVNDVKPGQILCQNVDEFGGTWLVVSPRGAAIQ
jgi:predicted lipoprotein with Yx(FWY)xxD motif